MKLASMPVTTIPTFSILSALYASSNAQAILHEVFWNSIYDNSAQPLSTLACAEWAAEHNIQTLGDVPRFPFVGGAEFTSGTECGGFNVLLDTETGVGIEVTIIDAAGVGYVISLEAMNALTDGQAEELGSVEVVIF